MSERDSTTKSNFRAIEAAMSTVPNAETTSLISKILILLQVQYGHNRRLKDDAAASLGVICKTAAHFVEAMDKQMMTGIGVTPSVWQSWPVKEMREERLKMREYELLKWAGVDLTAEIR